jgi:hypothetical protein
LKKSQKNKKKPQIPENEKQIDKTNGKRKANKVPLGPAQGPSSS